MGNCLFCFRTCVSAWLTQFEALKYESDTTRGGDPVRQIPLDFGLVWFGLELVTVRILAVCLHYVVYNKFVAKYNALREENILGPRPLATAQSAADVILPLYDFGLVGRAEAIKTCLLSKGLCAMLPLPQ